MKTPLDFIQEIADDLHNSLIAINDVMGSDKGLSEDEWIDWSNQYLGLVKKYGFQRNTVWFGGEDPKPVSLPVEHPDWTDPRMRCRQYNESPSCGCSYGECTDCLISAANA